MKTNRSIEGRKLYAQKLSMEHTVIGVMERESAFLHVNVPVQVVDRVSQKLARKSIKHHSLAPSPLSKCSLNDLIDSEVKSTAKYVCSHLNQAARNVTIREQFIRCVEFMTAPDVADIYHSKAKNRSQKAQDLKKNGKIFGVELAGKEAFPSFQFDFEKRTAFDEIRVLIEILRSDYDLNWQFSIWWITPNKWLNQECPLNVWNDQRRDCVVNAALSEMDAAAW